VFGWSGGQVPIAKSVRAAIDRVMAAWDTDPVALSQREWAVFHGARQEVATLFGCVLGGLVIEPASPRRH
jgi:hypothetical protein